MAIGNRLPAPRFVAVGEKMIEVKLRFWTDKIVQGPGLVLPGHAWTGGVVRMERNNSHGIRPRKPIPFNSLLEIGSAVERALLTHGITLHANKRMGRYLAAPNSRVSPVVPFKKGGSYSRKKILKLLGLAGISGGPWFTGYHKHDGQFYIFANVGIPGRTGHDYPNRWEQTNLRWYGKNRSRVTQPTIKAMLKPGAIVHMFWREDDRDEFRYEGLAEALESNNTTPVEILWTFDNK